MENSPVLLKSSIFGGFNKKEVLSYIFELNESTQEAQQKFAEQVEELSSSRDALSRSVGEMESRLAEMQANFDDITSKFDEETAKNAEAAELIEKLKSEIEKRGQDIEKKNNEILRFTAMNAELADKNRRLEEQREQVDLAASQIANLLSDAHNDAGKVIEEANREAARITAEAKRQADGIVAVAKASANNYINDANQTFDDGYVRFENFCNELGALKRTIADAASEMTAKVEAMDSTAHKIRESVPERLELTGAELLSYDVEEEPVIERIEEKKPDDTAEFAKEALGRYGVRKDDSGFFRLAAERFTPTA